MSYSLISQTQVTARKDHKCIWCGQVVPKSTSYLRERSTYDGHWQNFPWHLECKRSSFEHFRYAEDFVPYENERPDYRLAAGVAP